MKAWVLVALVLALAGVLARRRKQRRVDAGVDEEVERAWRYDALNKMLATERLPAALVDLDVLEANVRRYCALAAAHGKTIRLATKSVRVPALIDAIIAHGGGVIKGLMCFSVREARLLAERYGHTDILLGYPVAREDLPDVWALVVERGMTDLTLMVDCPAHLAAIDAFWISERRRTGTGANVRVSVCIDMDCSFRIAGAHIGPQRSPVRSLDAFARLLDAIQASECVELVGVMGYEAQISGVQDANPFDGPLMRRAIRLMQRLSRPDVVAQRRSVARLLAERGIRLRFFNAGGSGSLAQSAAEAAVTEVTAGSGFLQSHLFDYFSANPNKCAIAFALRVTRVPCPGVVTCQSGGFTASGKAAADKAPVLFLPKGAALSADEGFGEVQTPVILPAGVSLAVGDAVFARPAKAGEIAERFDRYILKRGERRVGYAETYRGLGYTFY